MNNPNKQLYVLGFAFDKTRQFVVLIKKNKPEWQAGRFNGVGGKIEPKEWPVDAMVREFKEETGITTQSNEWVQYASMEGPTWAIHVFHSYSTDVHSAYTVTDEQVVVKSIDGMDYSRAISNLSWLIPMAINARHDLTFNEAKVGYDR